MNDFKGRCDLHEYMDSIEYPNFLVNLYALKLLSQTLSNHHKRIAPYQNRNHTYLYDGDEGFAEIFRERDVKCAHLKIFTEGPRRIINIVLHEHYSDQEFDEFISELNTNYNLPDNLDNVDIEEYSEFKNSRIQGGVWLIDESYINIEKNGAPQYPEDVYMIVRHYVPPISRECLQTEIKSSTKS